MTRQISRAEWNKLTFENEMVYARIADPTIRNLVVQVPYDHILITGVGPGSYDTFGLSSAMDEWCKHSLKGAYGFHPVRYGQGRPIGDDWYVYVMSFDDLVDATLFKLMWS